LPIEEADATADGAGHRAMSETPRRPLRALQDQIEAWIRTRLWAQILVGLVLGILVGYAVGPDVGWVAPETAERIGTWLAFPSHLFLDLIALVLIPLVVGSIIQGLNGPQSAAELRSLSLGFLVYVLITTTAAATLGIVLVNTIRPGDFVAVEAPPVPMETPPREPAPAGVAAAGAPDSVHGMARTNLGLALLGRAMLALVVLAVFFGLACRAAELRRVAIVLDLVDGVLALSVKAVRWAVFLTPYVVFGLTAQFFARVGLATAWGMAAYVATVVLGLLGLLALHLLALTLLTVATPGRRRPVRFLANVADPLILAFSTSSSAAVMPLSIDTAVTKLDVPEGTASLVVPLGATINMAGTALYQSVALAFLAQVAGVELSIGQQVAILGTLVASSIGAPGIPGVGVVILGGVAVGFGIPATALPLVLGVDRILDMGRTAVNLAGDLVACVLLRPYREAGEEEQGEASVAA
jgi:Na+/H+-dicarboxylate symporter